MMREKIGRDNELTFVVFNLSLRLFFVDVFTARVLGKFKIPLPSFMFPS